MLGRFTAPDRWFSRVEATYLEPDADGEPDPRLLNQVHGTPGARFSIVRGQIEAASPQASLEEFATRLVQQMPGIRRLHVGPVQFRDGVEGATATFMMDSEGLTWVQRHLYRHDGGWVTHFTLSVVAQAQARLEGDLWDLVNAWEPSQDRG